MIGLIGIQRFMILLILSVLTVVLAVANFYYLRPKAKELSQSLTTINNENSTLRAEIETMKTGMAKFKQQQAFYNKIMDEGFYNLQDRVAIRESFNSLQRELKIVTLKYEIRSAFMMLPPGIQDNEFAILVSPLAIQIDAIDDIDVYNFIAAILYRYPGIVNITKFEIDRTNSLSTEMLREIGSGETHTFIKANIEADWLSIAPQGTAPWGEGFEPAMNAGGAP